MENKEYLGKRISDLPEDERENLILEIIGSKILDNKDPNKREVIINLDGNLTVEGWIVYEDGKAEYKFKEDAMIK